MFYPYPSVHPSITHFSLPTAYDGSVLKFCTHIADILKMYMKNFRGQNFFFFFDEIQAFKLSNFH